MHLKARFRSRLLVVAGLAVLGVLVLDVVPCEQDSTPVATKWKVRPAAGRNYRRFYRGYTPPMAPMMPAYGEVIESETPMPTVPPNVPQPEELPRRLN